MNRRRKSTSSRSYLVALTLALLLVLVAGVAQAYPNPQPPITGPSIETDTTNDFSYTVPAGTDRLLVVTVVTDSDQSAGSVTFDGNDLTHEVTADQGNAQVELWYRAMGSGGAVAGTVLITFPGNANPSVGLAMTYSDVDQADPIGVSDDATSSNCSSGLTLSLSGMDPSSTIHAAIGEDDDDNSANKFSSINVSEVWDDQYNGDDDVSWWAGYSLVDTNGERVVGADPDDSEECALAAMEINSSSPPAFNPDLPAACGLDFILILDASGSIDADEQDDVIAASDAFLSALVNTGSQVAVVEFASEAITRFGWTPLSGANLTTLQNYLNNTYHNGDVGQWTNWQDAMLATYSINAGGPVADMVVFMTDGDPTAYNDPSTGDPLTSQPEELAMLYAFGPADAVREQGSHLFGIGIALTAGDSEGRLSAATGPDEYPAPWADFAQGDYTLTTDFAGLADALQEVAFELCGNSLTVTKYVDDGHEQVALPDFPLSGTVNVTSGGGADDFNWELPVFCDVDGTPCSQTQGGVTAADGTFTWQWTPDDGTWSTEIDFSESSGDLTPVTPIDCDRFGLGDAVPTPFQIAGAQPWNVEFTTADIVTCDLINNGNFDWGDALNSYGTTAAASGPRHLVFSSDPYLGDLRDTEADGNPTAAATGDDTTGSADEDGVTFPGGSDWSDGQGEMDVDVTNGPACLNAWLDFNNNANTNTADGDFDDTGEHVVVNDTVADGVNNITFTLPEDIADAVSLFLRVRLTPVGNGACSPAEATNYLYADGAPTPYNQAFGGEIEDYYLVFGPTAVSLNNVSVGGANAGLLIALVSAGLLATATAFVLVTRRKRQTT